MQDVYKKTDLVITEFDVEDVITTSGGEGNVSHEGGYEPG